ncbi:ATP-dependent RNA helicase dbp3 [Penicillium atrosanguineum]|uniref:ML-like domain-containing protein n=1 Tax=Penicillium atrosanguineum TaxID=1132637 RepID=A0A9W9U7N7_9EURO|nr:ATP-dependent RNA helicase dbp3 [Penicillium atrosanguineum]KAJ5298694.1 ATP-dependent RNA helicase dbp3 [Penicillium atrosanguineum]KAJ5321040.1 hypothetical protein N7476_004042 [Penicillium atrosanguineum]
MRKSIWALLGLAFVPQVLAADTLSTDGFGLCMTDSDITVTNLDVTYTRSTKEVVFDLAGTNSKEQNVTANLKVTAYGNTIYTKTFNPCGSDVHVAKLCPVPSGSFSAKGSMTVPDSYASEIPSIAFAIPDLDGQAQLTLKSTDTDEDVACVESELSNGRTTSLKAVSWASAGIAAGALALSGISALSAAGHPGASPSSPGFGDVMGWFHSMATNGMLSVSYPTVYTSFTKNFGWSTGLISWKNMQESIDSFRKATGGNLTNDSYVYLTSLSSSSSNSSSTKRSVDLMRRSVNLLPRSDSNSTDSSSTVSTIKSFAEEAMIPSANVFMTVLLVFAIVIAVVVIWALYGNFPKKLTNFRKDYWGIMARTITNMILVLYSIWVLYCIYQLKNGDSWAAKLLAAVTLVVFTGVLAFFGWRIFYMARKYKRAEGDTTSLYDNKDTWRKYSLFYDNYKKDFWWLFVPIIVYALAKGCIIAGAEGHGMVQTIGQLVVEVLLLCLLAWNRPYARKSSMGINITIQIVRVLSVACILVFVEELGLSQTTKTVTGIVLIVVQSTLTGVLAILIAVNAIITCVRENPHAKRKREAEKNNRDLDDLTPLDARESLLIEHPQKRDFTEMSKFNFTGPYEPYRDMPHRSDSTGSKDRLVYADYGVARSLSQNSGHDGRHSPPLEGRQPTKPGYGMAY